MEHARARPFGVRAMMATARGGQWTPTRRRWAAGGTFRREFAESRHRRRQRRGRTRGRSRTRRQLARVSSHFPRATRRAASIDVGALPLAPDEKYIAERTGVPIPFLPVCRNEERKLFADLVITLVGMGSSASTIDYDAMALRWMERVDGKKIFPKLPVYLRDYHKRFEQNQRAKDAVRNAKPGIDRLKELFAESHVDPLPDEMASPMQDAQDDARREGGIVMVGGHPIGGGEPIERVGEKRKRSKDKAQRKKRVDGICTLCLTDDPEDHERAEKCPGRLYNGICRTLVTQYTTAVRCGQI